MVCLNCSFNSVYYHINLPLILQFMEVGQLGAVGQLVTSLVILGAKLRDFVSVIIHCLDMAGLIARDTTTSRNLATKQMFVHVSILNCPSCLSFFFRFSRG